MRKCITLISSSTGKPVSGYTLRAYKYSSTPPYYTGSPVVTFTDLGNGQYYADIEETFRGTLVIVTETMQEEVVPGYIGTLFEGNNQPTIRPD